MNTRTRNPDPTGFSSLSEANPTPTSPPQESSDDKATVPIPSSLSRPELTPPVVGKYAILEEESVGGMGIVYKAHDGELDRIVALKVIKGGPLATDEEITRFHREAQAAARLNHPNIIPVYEIGKERGCPYFTMAYAWGGSLAQHRGRFADPHAAAALLEKVARAVHFAHQRGIFHRDLKPANILFDENDTPLVSDFGLAKFVDANLELTRTGQVLGTPAYMAPEQASGQMDQISAQTDVWALGVLLYELLTGQRPFNGLSQEEKLRQVRTAEPPRPRSINRSLDRALETVILKCLEKEPSRRYASAEALANDLARWLRGEPVLVQPPSWPIRVGRAMRRYRRPALKLGTAVVLLSLLWLAWSGSPPSVLPEKTSEAKPPKEMEQLLARLQKGEKLTLIGKSGPFLAARWQPHRIGALRPPTARDDFFCINAGKRGSMLELLSAAPKRFRLSAQVQHRDSTDLRAGHVGIYFAHREHLADEIMTHSFFLLTFNDRTPTVPIQANAQPLSQACLTFAVYHEKGTEFLNEQNFSCEVSRLFIPAGKAKPMPWRTLEVEVTSKQIKAFWERQLIKSFRKETGADGVVKEVDGCDPRKILQRAARWVGHSGLFPQSQPDAEPALDGGLGLYVERGMAAFQSVEIEPLP